MNSGKLASSMNKYRTLDKLIPRKIILIVKDKKSRKLLEKSLQEEYQVITPRSEKELLCQSADLILVDEFILSKWENILQEIKNKEKPVFLPILLLTSQTDDVILYRQLQTIVSDLIKIPVSKLILKTRIKNSLHFRRLSLESDQRYHALAEKSPVSICILHCQKIVYANPAFTETCGKEYHQIFNVPFLELIYKADKQRVEKLLKSGSHSKLEEMRIVKANTIRWVEFNFTNIKYKDENSILITALDITERKASAEEIKYLSFHDKLTDLYNRNYFEEELNRLDTERQFPLSIIMGDVNGLKLVNDAFGHQTGDLQLKKIANIIKQVCRKEDIAARWGGDEFLILLPKTPYQIGEEICNRIRKTCSEANGEPIQLSLAMGIATKDSTKKDVNDILQEAENRMYKNKLAHNESIRNFIITSLENTLLEKSHETNEHAERMNKIVIKFAKKLNLSTNILDELTILTKLHDIGKVSISERILKKPGSLTDEEYEVIKGHPESGYRIIKAVPELAPVAESILAHHERWDGTGYPRGLSKEDIPYTARIISIVDSYDVMTHERSYKKAFSKEKAISEINRCAGSQFDPELTKVFINMIRDS